MWRETDEDGVVAAEASLMHGGKFPSSATSVVAWVTSDTTPYKSNVVDFWTRGEKHQITSNDAIL